MSQWAVYIKTSIYLMSWSLKVYMTRSLLDSSIEMEFCYQMKAPIFLINPVKSYSQQMLILKVTSENVAKVQKLL